jgi:hypothetical protein
VGKRWTRVAWSMLAVFAVSMVIALPLAIANGTFQQDAATSLCCSWASVPSWSSGPWSWPTGPATPSAGSSRPAQGYGGSGGQLIVVVTAGAHRSDGID